MPESELPVLLPEVADFLPTGESPLGRDEAFLSAVCPKCGGEARRETDTMDTFVDSSWYFLRFAELGGGGAPFSLKSLERWLPVDQYIGGIEHATMHLIYARFFVKALSDAFAFASSTGSPLSHSLLMDSPSPIQAWPSQSSGGRTVRMMSQS